MRRALMVLLVGAATAVLGGCSSSTACQDACEKKKRCAVSLNCDSVPAADKAGCLNAKATWSGDDCAAIKTCDPTTKAESDRYLACTLDNACRCKQGVTDGPPRTDINCRRPDDLSQCFAPGTKYHPTLWTCIGCGDCEGTFKVAACNLFTNDCRFFATSCIPKTYGLCDENAPNALSFLCGYCFFAEAGAAGLAKCNKLGELGTSKPLDASSKH